MPFLEEQLPGCMDYGSAVGAQYTVDVVVDAADNTYTHRRHPYPVKRFECGFGNKPYDVILRELLDLFHRCGGVAGGFRMPDRTEFSTNNYTETPTVGDQQCAVIDATAGTYQLMRWYGSPSDPSASRRRIRKPRAGSVLCGIKAANGITYPITTFTVDTTRGIVTLAADKEKAITAISQAAQAVVTVGAGHGIIVGDSVVVTGVTGMTEINGLRATVSAVDATTITLGSINSTGFTAYASGGKVNTRPQSGEVLMAGCLFDIPVRFETDMSGISFSNLDVLSTVINLVEILNPDPQ